MTLKSIWNASWNEWQNEWQNEWMISNYTSTCVHHVNKFILKWTWKQCKNQSSNAKVWATSGSFRNSCMHFDSSWPYFFHFFLVSLATLWNVDALHLCKHKVSQIHVQQMRHLLVRTNKTLFLVWVSFLLFNSTNSRELDDSQFGTFPIWFGRQLAQGWAFWIWSISAENPMVLKYQIWLLHWLAFAYNKFKVCFPSITFHA